MYNLCSVFYTGLQVLEIKEHQLLSLYIVHETNWIATSAKTEEEISLSCLLQSVAGSSKKEE